MNVFGAVWGTYLEGKFNRLAVHPVANFVVAKALERVTHEQLQQAFDEVNSVAEKIYSQSNQFLHLYFVQFFRPFAQNHRVQVFFAPWSNV